MAKRSFVSAGTSKLARQVQDAENAEQSTPARPAASSKLQPKSYRLTPTDIARLRNALARVSETAGRPISETDLIKGLLLIGEKTDARKLLAAIKDAVFEG